MRYVQLLCALVVVAVCGALPAKHHRSIPKSYKISGTNPRYARQDSEIPLVEGDQSPEQVVVPLADVPQEPDSLNETEPQEDLPQEEQGTNVDEQVPVQSETTEAVVLADAEPSLVPAAEVPAEAPSDEPVPVAEDAAPESLAPPAPEPVPAAPVVPVSAPVPAAPVVPVSVPVPAVPVVPVPAPVPSAPARKNKTNKGRKPAAPAAVDDGASWPFGAPGRGASSYNTFFPIYIGGSSGRAHARSANGAEGNFPGSATAIANSFSTGKGSAANSHATSFGDPSAAAALRSGLFSSRYQA